MSRIKRRPSRVVIAVALMAETALVAAACGSDSDEEAPRRAQVKQGCSINSDCKSPLKCAFQRCHAECDDQRNCQARALGVPADRPFKVCLFEEEKHCAYHSDCPDGFVCAVDLTCRPQCQSVRDCISRQVCVEKVCAAQQELYPPLLEKLRFTPGRLRGRALGCRVYARVDHTFVDGKA
jgi:hypothetical protein